MKNVIARVASALLASSLASVAMAQDAAAPLATVQSVSGNVLISTADGYTPLTADTLIKPGDRITILEGGQVSLAYQGGCVDVVNTASIYTVPVTSPCAAVASTPAEGAAAPTGAAASGGGGGMGAWGSKEALIGVGILAGAAAVGVALDNDDEQPVSP